jgi:hypothetical protein
MWWDVPQATQLAELPAPRALLAWRAIWASPHEKCEPVAGQCGESTSVRHRS